MKLEGEDRERPWDEATIVGGSIAMVGCWWGAGYFATAGLSHVLVIAVYVYSTWQLLPLMFADLARIERNNQQLEAELQRLKARQAELERQDRQEWWDER